jgi:hypothetical protein
MDNYIIQVFCHWTMCSLASHFCSPSKSLSSRYPIPRSPIVVGINPLLSFIFLLYLRILGWDCQTYYPVSYTFSQIARSGHSERSTTALFLSLVYSSQRSHLWLAIRKPLYYQSWRFRQKLHLTSSWDFDLTFRKNISIWVIHSFSRQYCVFLLGEAAISKF